MSKIIEEFKNYVRENVAVDDRLDASVAYFNFKKENGYSDNIEYPFNNETYFNL